MGKDRIGLYLKSRVAKQIKWYGEEYIFVHTGEDKYHRPVEPVKTFVKGLYHVSTSYANKISSDGATISKKPQPMLLCLYEDANTIKVGDQASINGTTMLVTGCENVQQLNVVMQISLEVQEDA